MQKYTALLQASKKVFYAEKTKPVASAEESLEYATKLKHLGSTVLGTL
jgi:hypothetical protein